jgi:hypothetical protein
MRTRLNRPINQSGVSHYDITAADRPRRETGLLYPLRSTQLGVFLRWNAKDSD